MITIMIDMQDTIGKENDIIQALLLTISSDTLTIPVILYIIILPVCTDTHSLLTLLLRLLRQDSLLPSCHQDQTCIMDMRKKTISLAFYRAHR